jgi:polyisoprenyl-teichoic acid--peptidoglycan teichoic acid transferase
LSANGGPRTPRSCALPESYVRPRVFLRFVIGAMIIVIASASATAVAGWHEVDKVVSAFQHTKHIKGINDVITEADAGKPQTILLMGSDKRSKNSSDVRRGLIGKPLSDTMILMRLDPSKRATALLSLPRDLKVEIPGYGTDKLNAAYSLGGARLTVRTIRGLDPRLKINHVINVDFHGFSKAVNALGCIYVDVDRRYYNDSDLYSKINIQAGYQRLCGQDALAYVRYRHEDNDLVRATRQQDFLRQVKAQVGAFGLIKDRDKLLHIFSSYTSSDLDSRSGILRLLKLAVFSASRPIQEVHFHAKIGPSYVYARPAVIDKVVTQFLGVKASKGPKGVLRPKSARDRRRQRREDIGLEYAPAPFKDQALQAVNDKVGVFPVYYPTKRVTGSLTIGPPNVYKIQTRSGRRYSAYRIVIKKNFVGEYYGLQGTTFTHAPLLDQPHTTRTIRGRKFYLYADGSRLRLVAWKDGRSVYWISNTLLLSLTNRQMLSIAASTKHL